MYLGKCKIHFRFDMWELYHHNKLEAFTWNTSPVTRYWSSCPQALQRGRGLLTPPDCQGCSWGSQGSENVTEEPQQAEPCWEGKIRAKTPTAITARTEDATAFWGRIDHTAAGQPQQPLNTMGVVLQEPAHPSSTSLQCVKTYSAKLLRKESKNLTDLQRNIFPSFWQTEFVDSVVIRAALPLSCNSSCKHSTGKYFQCHFLTAPGDQAPVGQMEEMLFLQLVWKEH